MKMRRKLLATVSSLAVVSTVLLAGCGAPAKEGTALEDKGILTLSVNPEIQIEYDKDGKVTELTGQNDDGKGIVEVYPDYIGKDCAGVLQDLIVEIHEAGYFVEEVDGNKKNIVLQLEPGSVLPSDDFLENMNASTQEAVKGLDLSSGIVMIDDDDYDPAYAKDGKPSPYITLEKAQEIALTQANVNAANAVFDDKEFDHDDGTPVFELEFTANGVEYEYDVHAVTGKVLKAKHEMADVPGADPNGAGVSGGYDDDADDWDDADDRDDADDWDDDYDDRQNNAAVNGSYNTNHAQNNVSVPNYSQTNNGTGNGNAYHDDDDDDYDDDRDDYDDDDDDDHDDNDDDDYDD